MKKIEQFNSTKYKIVFDKYSEVEIGDKNHFKPTAKLKKWGDECFIKVSLPTTKNILLIEEDDKVKWKDTDKEVHLYQKEESFEFEVVLKEKPKSNKVVFDIETKGLRFTYQPELTQEAKDRGDIRPENVIGSYAVYHESKKNNKYKTGKAFHIYRPMVEDAVGNKEWCLMNVNKAINPTKLTITIPQSFLDEAQYPIILDPTFGYSTHGSSWVSITSGMWAQRYGSAWEMPAGGGTVNWLKAYINPSEGDEKVSAVINQKDSGGEGTHGQIALVEVDPVASGAHEQQFTFSSEELTGGVNYILNAFADRVGPSGQVQLAYDANGAVASYYQFDFTYGSHESPWTQAAEGTTNDYTIWCDYTSAGNGNGGKMFAMF